MNSINIYEEYVDRKIFEFNKVSKDNIQINSDYEFNRYLRIWIQMNNRLYFNEKKCCMLYFINDICYILDKNEIYMVKQLFEYANLNNKEELLYISESLYCYHCSISSDYYKSNINESQEEMISEFYIQFPKNYFYNKGLVVKNAMEFFRKLIPYLKKTSKNLNYFNIQKILYLLKVNSNIYDSFLDYCIYSRYNRAFLIKYDNDIRSHINAYKTDLNSEQSIFEWKSNNLEILKRLIEKQYITDKELKEILNTLVDKVNRFVNIEAEHLNYLNKIDSYERIINLFNEIISLDGIKEQYRVVLKKNRVKLLYAKRYFIKNVKIDDMDLIKSEYSIKVSQKDIKQIIGNLRKNISYLYSLMKINFIEELKCGINEYSEHALLYMTSTITSDNSGMYTYEFRTYDDNNNMRNFFNNIGKEYITKEKDNLVNILKDNYYDNMFRTMKNKIDIKNQLISSLLKNEIEYIKEQMVNQSVGGIKEKNDYVLIMREIIGVEKAVYEILKINGIDISSIQSKNLDELFSILKDDETAINMIMYIYYYLYYINGKQLRDMFAHGKILEKNDYTEEVLIVYSCVIAANYLKEKYGRIL